jgi:hypothetical protein
MQQCEENTSLDAKMGKYCNHNIKIKNRISQTIKIINALNGRIKT